jgi:hypothetical protein
MKTSFEVDDEVWDAARRHSAATGVSLRTLVEDGLRAVLGIASPAPGWSERDAARDLEAMRSFCESLRPVPDQDARGLDELLGYDEAGFPR